MNTRTPSEARPPRMEALARLPVFYALTGKRAVVAGGSAAAAWKAELLAAAGAAVEVYARRAERGDDRDRRAGRPSRSIAARSTPTDLDGAAMAIGAFEDDAEAAAFAAMARRAGVPVNVIDKPAFCDFSFGSIVNRSPLVIGISTDGAAPVFGQAIRAKLEALIPRGFARWAEAARQLAPARAGARAVVPRAAPLLGAVHRARGRGAGSRAGDTRHRRADGARRAASRASAGSVVLVGAGPGDPELLTLRAVRALQSADVILIDDLVAPRGARFRAPRGEEDDGRQDRPWAGVPAGRDQRADDQARQGGQARGAAQGRRPDDLRPRRRGDRGLPRRGHSGRGRARHLGRAGRGVAAAGFADASRRRRAGCNTSPATTATASCRRTSTGARSPIRRRRRSSTCRRRRCAS